jgi:hypothetical protein
LEAHRPDILAIEVTGCAAIPALPAGVGDAWPLHGNWRPVYIDELNAGHCDNDGKQARNLSKSDQPARAIAGWIRDLTAD